MGTLVVGVCGAARAGKDTVVRHIVDTYGDMGVARYAFADSLKLEIFEWLQGLSVAYEAYGSAELMTKLPFPPHGAVFSEEGQLQWIERHKDELRKLLQVYGTQHRRTQNTDYWVDRALERIAHDSPRIALLSDTRFRNEVEICHVTVKVERTGDSGINDPTIGQHISERELAEFRPDYVISAASGDVDALKLQAERVFQEIVRRFRVQ